MKRAIYLTAIAITVVVMAILFLTQCSTCISFSSEKECRCVNRTQAWNPGSMMVPVPNYWYGETLQTPKYNSIEEDTTWYKKEWMPDTLWYRIRSDSVWLGKSRRDLDEMRILQKTQLDMNKAERITREMP